MKLETAAVAISGVQGVLTPGIAQTVPPQPCFPCLPRPKARWAAFRICLRTTISLAT
jgi:hypothetical protein